MSRKKVITDDMRFEINGIVYELVNPRNLEELIKAVQMKDTINVGLDLTTQEDKKKELLSLLRLQEIYINNYLESIGNFDNSHLINNVNFISKKYGLRIGEIERMLGVSAGYISRTAKENSSKKLSIDVVWKIARLFEIEIQTLIGKDMQIPDKTTTLLQKFMRKLYEETTNNTILWVVRGGYISKIDKQYKSLGMLEETDEQTIYHAPGLNPEIKWVLCGDIVATERFNGRKELAIIPYAMESYEENPKPEFYDFIFVWNDASGTHWEKVFYTNEDAFGYLEEYAAILYNKIDDMQFESGITREIRGFIADYLKETER